MKRTGKEIIDYLKLTVPNHDPSRTFIQWLEECKQRAIREENYEWAQRLHEKIGKETGASPK